MRIMSPAEIRFWRYVLDPSACWEWRGARNPAGYGTVSDGGRKRLASRAAWELRFGPIPEGLHVLHRCDNPPCVNPDHLFLGTDLDNAKDREAKNRTSRGVRHYNAKLTDEIVIAMRRAADEGKSTTEIGEMFGTTRFVAYKVISRQTWKHVPVQKLERRR